jgi:DNA-directed RNA polymerase specialized sigma24 family protein
MTEHESGVQPAPTREINVRALLGFNDSPAEIDEASTWYEHVRDGMVPAPNAWLVDEADRFPLDVEGNADDWGSVWGASRLLRAVAAESAPRLANKVIDRVRELDDPFRTVVVNRFFVGSSSERIAEGLGCSVTTVDFLLRAALGQLRGLADEQGSTDAHKWIVEPDSSAVDRSHTTD